MESARHRYYPLVLALIAFVSTATFSFPFAFVLILGVLIARHRWLVLGLVCSIASALGGALLSEIFQFMGQEFVMAGYPKLIANENWLIVSGWLKAYGLFGLLLIAGSLLPQTHAVFLYSLTGPSTLSVLLDIGKSVKYVFLSWLISHYPARFSYQRKE